MDNVVVVPPVRRRRLRDDVLELLKVIAHLALIVAPTEIGRLLKGGVEYLWKRASVSVLHCREGSLTDRFVHIRKGENCETRWLACASRRRPC